MRILFTYRAADVDTKGGAASVMHRTAEALDALGHEVEISHDLHPDVAGFDVVHPINIWAPDTALDQLRHLRQQNATVVWQPFYLGYSEQVWARMGMFAIFGSGRAEHEREELLRQFTAGELEVNGLRRWGRNEPHPDFWNLSREMVELVDHIAVISLREVQMISNDIGLRGTAWTHVPHGVEAAKFADASPDAFREHTGIGDVPYLLCVGAVDPRKNQAMVAHALRDAPMPLVLLGPALEPDYLELVKAAGAGNVVHIDRVPPEIVASAFAGAEVHVLASWAEGMALANLEAAAAGTPLVVSDRTSEFEYFGPVARYCDPADPASIARAVEESIGAREHDRERIDTLQQKMRELTWERTAEACLAAYERAIADTEGREPPPPPEPAPPEPPPVSPQLREFTDALPWVRTPILEFVQQVATSLEDGTRVLDAGAGESPFAELFAHCEYVRRDFPLEGEGFDVVLCTGSLAHVLDAEGAFAQMHAALRDGGLLYATTEFVRDLHQLPHDFHRFTPWALYRTAIDAGFAQLAVEPRNDTFTTVAQLIADVPSEIGSYPDGLDNERANAAGQLRGLADQIADLRRLDARWALPLGYRIRGWKAPLPEVEPGPKVEGTRGQAVLAHAGELLFDPSLLRAYAGEFGEPDDVTLVIYAPNAAAAELEPRLLQLVAQAGLNNEDAPDLLVLPDSAEVALASSVRAVLSINPPRGPFWRAPHFHQAQMAELRELIGRS